MTRKLSFKGQLTKIQRDYVTELEEKAVVVDEHRKLLGGTRAGKMLLKGKKFITVAMDEHYYAEVYRTIRLHEKQRGRWTNEDESEFQVAMQMWFDFHAGL